MTTALAYTLLREGPSDRCLLRVIDWILDNIPEVASRGVVPQMADLRTLDNPPSELHDRMLVAVRQFPCDVLFVHRDADREPMEVRLREIREAALRSGVSPHVPVVPVRMTEAWLLIDEGAIRTAAGNPNGVKSLDLPPPNRLEGIPNPKASLDAMIIRASEKTGRRLDSFKRELPRRKARIADLIEDFGALRHLPAFVAFERDTKHVLLRWAGLP